jgi:hypothetical protein
MDASMTTMRAMDANLLSAPGSPGGRTSSLPLECKNWPQMETDAHRSNAGNFLNFIRVHRYPSVAHFPSSPLNQAEINFPERGRDFKNHNASMRRAIGRSN